METRKVDVYACSFIETIWKMMQFYNYISFTANRTGIYRMIKFIEACNTLYYSIGPLSFRGKTEVYKYMRIQLYTNTKINPVQYLIYSIRAFFEIYFTRKPIKIGRDIIDFANKYVFAQYFSKEMTLVQKIKNMFGYTKEDLTNKMNMYIYMEARGYDVRYG